MAKTAKKTSVRGPPPPIKKKGASQLIESQPAPSHKEGVYIEYFDVEGIQCAYDKLKCILHNPDLSIQHKKATYYVEWLNTLLRVLGPEIQAPKHLVEDSGGDSFLVRSLRVVYNTRNGDGRRYPKGLYVGPVEEGEKMRSAVCLQGCPRLLRPFLCGRFAIDIDACLCHPTLITGFVDLLYGEEGMSRVSVLASYVADRAGWMKAIIECHNLEGSDANDRAKQLINRIVYGGTYERWIDDNRMPECHPKCQRVQRLYREITALRIDVFKHKVWSEFVAYHTDRMKSDKKASEWERSDEHISRSIWARIAQGLEDDMLRHIEDALSERGWTVLSLVFDGLIVARRPMAETMTALRYAERVIHEKMFINMRLLEKPLRGLHQENLVINA
jgi:hypothetical protein